MHDRSTTDLFPASHEEDLEETRPHRPPPGLALDPPEDPPPEHPPEIPVDRLDADAAKVIARLRHMHHQAYFVGGCVRDLLLGAKPKDFDLATDAHPGEVRAIFRNCRLIGRRFRLAHVYFRGGKVIEVATFRKNPVDVGEDVPDSGDLLITRDNVFGTAEEDAVRRDFTVNGLFYDVSTGEVIDYVGGRADLEARRIATIGDPEIRMREDPVRLLRAVRFAARLGFIIAPDTFEAMRRHAGELARCAPARVLEEIFKILRCGGSARAFELLRASGALPVTLQPLASALEGWDEAARRAFFAHLGALDRLVRSGAVVSEAVLLGAIVMHLGDAAAGEPLVEPEEAAPEEPSPLRRGNDAAGALLASLVQTARLPRKIAERTRLALHAFRMFRDPPKKRRRRGRGGAGQSYFEDALQLLEISVAATGEGHEALERWRSSARGQPPAREHREEHREEHRRSPERAREPRRGPSPAGSVAVAAVEIPEVEEMGTDETPSVEVAAGGEAPRPGSEASPAAGEARRRRRRRGGRRRRRRGQGEEAAPA